MLGICFMRAPGYMFYARGLSLCVGRSTLRHGFCVYAAGFLLVCERLLDFVHRVFSS